MKLAKGVTVSIGREKFIGEIPDDIAKKHGLIPEKKEKTEDKK